MKIVQKAHGFSRCLSCKTDSPSVFSLWFRSREIEATGCNGDAAFLAVRVQQVVIEFILNHVDQIFNSGAPGSLQNDGTDSSWCIPRFLCPSLPWSSYPFFLSQC